MAEHFQTVAIFDILQTPLSHDDYVRLWGDTSSLPGRRLIVPLDLPVEGVANMKQISPTHIGHGIIAWVEAHPTAGDVFVTLFDPNREEVVNRGRLDHSDPFGTLWIPDRDSPTDGTTRRKVYVGTVNIAEMALS